MRISLVIIINYWLCANDHTFLLCCYRPLHLCVATWNVSVVKRWVEVANSDEIAEAIDIPSPIGTALCMAAASKKDHESGMRKTSLLDCDFDNWLFFLLSYLFIYYSISSPSYYIAFILKL